MSQIYSNIFSNIPNRLPEELFETVLKTDHVRIERIVSRNHSTKAGHWYDQDWDEWILLLQGQAKLRYKNRPEDIVLNPGDYLLIPAHTLHRVEWTDRNSDTIWLAIHMTDKVTSGDL